MEQTILVQKNSHGRIKFIILEKEHNTLNREWGIIGGKTQKTSNTYDYINKGKANELNPLEVATADYDRIIKRKTKEGYIKTNSLYDLPDIDKNSQMDLDNIPTQFCCSKPTSKISDKALNKLIAAENAKFQIKYNGLCHYILIDTKGDVKIYTRRMDDHTVKYPAIVESVKGGHYPPGTIFITEFVIDPQLDYPHMEAFRLMSQISKANISKSVPKKDLSKNFAYQAANRVRACVFGILYWNGQLIADRPYHDIFKTIKFQIPNINQNHELFFPEEITFFCAAKAREFVRKNKSIIEGLVVWDITKSMEITMNGKTKRRAAWKIKVAAEIDVIAFGYNEGSGPLQGKIGSLQIGKLKTDGSIFSMGDVGSGLKPKNGDCELENWQFPCVVEVEYDQIFPTGKLQFPRFIKKHEDKLPEDIKKVEV